MLLLPDTRILRPYEKPSFEYTQRYGLDWQNAKVSLEGCALYTLMNEGSGNKVFDLSGQKNDLDFINSPTWGAGKYGSDIKFVSASNQYLKRTIPVTSIEPPFTMVFWFKAFTVNINYILASICDYNSDNRQLLTLRGEDAGDFVRMYSLNGGTALATTSNPFIANRWHMIVAIWAAVDDRRIILDADFGNMGTDATSVTVPNTDTIVVGGQIINSNFSTASAFDGEVSHGMIYNRIVSNSEVAELYAKPFCQLWKPKTQIVIGWVIGVDGVLYVRTIDDTLGLTDVETEVKEIIRTFDESIGVMDDDTKVHEAIRSVAESMGITDTVDGIKGIIRTIADSIGITDDEARVIVFIRTIAESMGITDTASRIQEVYRVIAETMGVTDSMTRIALVERVIANTLGITDNAEALKELLKVINDSVGLTDSVTRICLVIRTVAESMGLTDVDTRVWEAVRTFAELIGITDIMDAIKSGGEDFIRTINNAMGMTDATSRTHIALRILSENLGLTDSIAKVLAISRLVSDSMGITDGVALGRLIEVTDNLGITDDVTRLIDYIRTQDDDIGLIDSLVRVATVSRTINDMMGLTDVMAEQLGDLTKAVWAFIILKKTK